MVPKSAKAQGQQFVGINLSGRSRGKNISEKQKSLADDFMYFAPLMLN